MKQETIAEQLLYTTVRIETRKSLVTRSGVVEQGGVATAFTIHHMQGDTGFPFLVTNRHVTHFKDECTFFFTKARNQQPITGEIYPVQLWAVGDFWQTHPDPTVDVAIYPLNPVLSYAKEFQGIELYYRPIGPWHIPSDQQLAAFDALEEVVFVGYPNGIWDSTNNLPIFRRGITATPLAIDFEGKPQFLIDAAVHFGSSGSSVFLYNNGVFAKRGSTPSLGSRIAFLGILTKGFLRDQTNEVEPSNTSVSVAQQVTSKHSLNLGVVFKTSTIYETIDAFMKRFDLTN